MRLPRIDIGALLCRLGLHDWPKTYEPVIKGSFTRFNRTCRRPGCKKTEFHHVSDY